MAGSVLYGLLALAACATAASISGMASIDPTKAVLGGQVTFPRIPGINAPLFGWGGLTSPFFGWGGSTESSGSNSDDAEVNGTGSVSSVLGPFAPFLRLVPGLELFLPGNGALPNFGQLDEALAKLPVGGNRTSGNYSLPGFELPSLSRQPYLPGLSEALGGARRHLRAALNVTTDLGSGLREVLRVALDGEDPAAGVRVILDTIAGVYSTVAANCPLLIVGARVFGEGVRLAGEVVKSVVNVALGPENNNVAVTF